MSEAIAFIAGLFAMMVVWFINDNSRERLHIVEDLRTDIEKQ